LGDGAASGRVVADLVRRLAEDDFRGHLTEHHHLVESVARSSREDGLE
jgi:hypothetical protein